VHARARNRLSIAGESLVGGTVVAATAAGGPGLAEAAKGTAKIVRQGAAEKLTVAVYTESG